MTPQRLELAGGGLSVGIEPANGGALTHFRCVDARGAFDWLRPAPASGGSPLEAACFPMVPFFSRVAGDRFVFEGREVRLPPAGHGFRTAIHGFGWLSAWEVEALSETRAVLAHDHRPPPDGEVGWPWPYRALQTVELAGGAMTIRLELTNTGTTAMPAGLGLHPFFAADGDLRVRTGTDAMIVMDERGFPAGRDPAAGAVRILADGGLLPTGLDNIFAGWSGSALLSREGRSLLVEADAPFAFLCVYTPPGQPFACVEPVSHITDGFNAETGSAGRTGVRVLGPGERLIAGVRFSPK
ncbi:aldose 1-epimerase [Pseudoxanthobacter soli DSM 19599]|uniref:Aldose 1-epimerase n=1 Tax=Pseudoxanthobacter soli DSM 19599 TaxID=1123029 RepID=A0A1M7ZRN3_9HYPH|nr:aldose 1-epimerase [Pseudoxanthobacter soli]SHO67482.1 aldose 1-epimerase [Pseudoxanthobacter soli DSM 19599]